MKTKKLVVTLLALIISTTCFAGDHQDKKLSEIRKKQEEKEKIASSNKLDFGFTYKKLISRIEKNKIAKGIPLSPKLDSKNKRDDGIIIRTTVLKDNTVVMLTETKENNFLTSVFVMASGDGTISSGSDIILSLVAIIQTIDLSLTSNQAGKFLMEDLGLSKLVKDGDEHELIKNKVKYSLSINSLTGVMFIISPIK